MCPIPVAVSARLLRPLLAVAFSDAGDGIADQLGLCDGALTTDDERVLVEDRLAFWTTLSRLSADDCFGLHAAERAEPLVLGLVGSLLELSATPRDAFARAERTIRLLSDRVHVGLDINGTTASIEIDTERLIIPRQAAEFSAAAMVAIARRLVGDDFCPLRVEFTHSRPADTGEHERILRCELRFDAPITRVAFSSRWLDVPLPKADATVCQWLDAYAAVKVNALPVEEPFDRALERAYTDAVVDGEPTLVSVARRLGLRARTLQRRLADSARSHSAMIDATRHRLAIELLANTDQQVKDIAFSLGFSEPSAFTRAFRRWIGCSPAAYRRRV